MKKRESEYRDQFIQYVVTEVPLTGLWVSKGQVLVKEDETLKVFPLTDTTDSEFTTEDDAEIYILNAARKAIDRLLERQLIERSQINVDETKRTIKHSRKLIESYKTLRFTKPMLLAKVNRRRQQIRITQI
jgi:hypothetical protein